VVVATDVVEKLDDVVARLGVEVARRFVGQNDVRCVEQGARDDDALLFATGERIRHTVALVLHPDLRQNGADALIHLLA
jgi:hypothetical protein